MVGMAWLAWCGQVALKSLTLNLNPKLRKAVSFGLITAQKLPPLVLSLRKAVSFRLITAQSCLVWSYHCANLSRVVLSLRKAALCDLVTAQSCHMRRYALNKLIHVMQGYTAVDPFMKDCDA